MAGNLHDDHKTHRSWVSSERGRAGSILRKQLLYSHTFRCHSHPRADRRHTNQLTSIRWYAATNSLYAAFPGSVPQFPRARLAHDVGAIVTAVDLPKTFLLDANCRVFLKSHC